jgi:plasmid stabilization system protein ParE
MNSLLIAYSPTAIEELLEIENYLESQDIGAKQRFRDEFDAELEPLLLFPESAPVIYKPNIRKRLRKRFRYKIFFAVENEYLIVLHVIHPRQLEDFDELLAVQTNTKQFTISSFKSLSLSAVPLSPVPT